MRLIWKKESQPLDLPFTVCERGREGEGIDGYDGQLSYTRMEAE